MNGSNVTSGIVLVLPDEFYTAVRLVLWSDVICSAMGVALNGWLLASIVTSRSLRDKLRNQVICCLAASHILEDVFLASFDISWGFNFLEGRSVLSGCHAQTYMLFMRVACSIVPDLLVVELSLLFLAQTLDFRPACKLKPALVRVGKDGILLFPWVFAVVASPLTFIGMDMKYRDGDLWCFFLDFSRFHIIEAVFTVLPLCVATVVTASAAFLRWTRFRRGQMTSQGNMSVQLLGSGVEIDSSPAYIGVLLVCAASETFYQVVLFRFKDFGYVGFINEAASILLESCRAVFLPLMFLFLTDIRQRLKSWRPWAQTGPDSGVDLSVGYTSRVV